MTDRRRKLLESAGDTRGLAESLVGRILRPLGEAQPPALLVESCPHPLDENMKFVLLEEDRRYRIGRKSEICEFSIRDPLVSKAHALVSRLGHRTFLTDDRSKNGVMVNGHLLSRGQPKRLRDGDTIALGMTRLRFRDSCAAPIDSISDLVSTWVRGNRPPTHR